MNTNMTGKEFKGMSGAFAAMFTPFDKKGRVNEEAIDALIEHGLKGVLKGFYLTGSSGEGMLLTNEERVLVYRRAVKAAKGRCKLIAQVGCVRTDDSVMLAKAAADAAWTGYHLSRRSTSDRTSRRQCAITRLSARRQTFRSSSMRSTVPLCRSATSASST